MGLHGNILDYAVVFFAGILVSFTPCVYPLLPVTAAAVAGANTSGTRWGGFRLSLLYVLGLALVYSALAVAASLSGTVFGVFQQSPWVHVAAGNALILFALIMFDVIPLPVWRARGPGKAKGPWTIFGLGLVSGAMVGPCTAPVLGSLLIYVASRQNIVHGVSLMFVFALGLGASLVLAGTFSGFLSSLPRSGPWVVRVRMLAGFLLLAAAQVSLVRAGQLF